MGGDLVTGSWQGWFQLLSGCISLSPTPHQFSLFLSLTMIQQQAAASSLQTISISFLSPNQLHHFRLTISEFISWTRNLRK
jgi:hypothetical protein